MYRHKVDQTLRIPHYLQRSANENLEVRPSLRTAVTAQTTVNVEVTQNLHVFKFNSPTLNLKIQFHECVSIANSLGPNM